MKIFHFFHVSTIDISTELFKNDVTGKYVFSYHSSKMQKFEF